MRDENFVAFDLAAGTAVYLSAKEGSRAKKTLTISSSKKLNSASSNPKTLRALQS